MILYLALLFAPLLSYFSELRNGALDNANSFGMAPRLLKQLSWFDTPDNSLWGDHGWRTKHCKGARDSIVRPEV